MKKGLVRSILLGGLFFVLLALFSVTKIPEQRLSAYLTGMLQSALDPIGVYLIPKETQFSVLKGFELEYIDPEIELPDLTRIRLTSLKISPSFKLLFQAMAGGKIRIEQGAGVLVLHAGQRGSRFQVEFDAGELNLDQLGLLALAADLKGNAIASGTGKLSGSMDDPMRASGPIQITLRKMNLSEQNIHGFQIPSMNIADGSIHADFLDGKITITECRIGRAKSKDDLFLDLTGVIQLNRVINQSKVNLQVLLGLSDRVKPKFSMLDTFLANNKTPDGHFGLSIQLDPNNGFATGPYGGKK
jgi:type II secretion system protein N